MSAQALLQDLTSYGVSLSVSDGDRIAVDGPRDALDKWLPEIRAQKAELIRVLTDWPANDDADTDRHHTWRIITAEGERFSSMFCPPLSLAEVQARYPGAQVEREPDPAPAPPLSPAALEIAYAWLRHVGETDLEAGQQFIEAVARDPEQLAALYRDVVAAGLADWPTAETEPDTDTGIVATAKAVCSRCAHWTPDRINPAGGLGRCRTGAPASRRPGSCWPWPDAEIHCTSFEESRQ